MLNYNEKKNGENYSPSSRLSFALISSSAKSSNSISSLMAKALTNSVIFLFNSSILTYSLNRQYAITAIEVTTSKSTPLPKPKNPASGSLKLGAKAKKLTTKVTRMLKAKVAGVIFFSRSLLYMNNRNAMDAKTNKT